MRITNRLSYALKQYFPHALQQRKLAPSRVTRALAFKWIRILYRCWRTQTAYDESTYLNALKRRGSPLLNSIGQAA